jgi:hypothetical protein
MCFVYSLVAVLLVVLVVALVFVDFAVLDLVLVFALVPLVDPVFVDFLLHHQYLLVLRMDIRFGNI